MVPNIWDIMTSTDQKILGHIHQPFIVITIRNSVECCDMSAYATVNDGIQQEILTKINNNRCQLELSEDNKGCLMGACLSRLQRSTNYEGSAL